MTKKIIKSVSATRPASNGAGPETEPSPCEVTEAVAKLATTYASLLAQFQMLKGLLDETKEEIVKTVGDSFQGSGKDGLSIQTAKRQDGTVELVVYVPPPKRPIIKIAA